MKLIVSWLDGEKTIRCQFHMATTDHAFHTNIIAYCQQNWYVWLAIYIDRFTLNQKETILLSLIK